MYYTDHMNDDKVSVRELRINTSQVLRRIESGEQLTVTVDGRPVADLVPRPMRAQWLPKRRALPLFGMADPALRDELDEVFPETTDDLIQRVERIWSSSH